MIKALYGKYFQKSKVFLFPLLQFPGRSEELKNIVIHSYLHVENANDDLDFLHSLTEPTLAVEFKINSENEEERKKLVYHVYRTYGMSNHVKEKFFCPDLKSVIIVYTLFDLQEDYDKIVSGQYSRLSAMAKTRIQRYFGAKSQHWNHVKTFLYPKNYYETYADLLGVDPDLLEARRELVDAPDLEQETLKIDLNYYQDSVIF